MPAMSQVHTSGYFFPNSFAFRMRALHHTQAGRNMLLQDLEGASVMSRLAVFQIPV